MSAQLGAFHRGELRRSIVERQESSFDCPECTAATPPYQETSHVFPISLFSVHRRGFWRLQKLDGFYGNKLPGSKILFGLLAKALS